MAIKTKTGAASGNAAKAAANVKANIAANKAKLSKPGSAGSTGSSAPITNSAQYQSYARGQSGSKAVSYDLKKEPTTSPFERRRLAPGTPTTPAETPTPIKPLTSEEVGKASVLAGTNAFDKDYNRIFKDEKKINTSFEQQVKDLAMKQNEQRKQTQQEIDTLNEIDSSNTARNKESIRRGLEGSKSTLAGDRNVGSSAGNAIAISQAGREAGRQTGILQQNFQMAKDKRDQAYQNLLDAQEGGRKDLVAKYRSDWAAAEADYIKELNAQSTREMQAATQLIETTLPALGLAVGNLTYDQLETMTKNTNIDMGTALQLQAGLLAKAEAENAKTEVEQMTKMAEYDKIMQGIKFAEQDRPLEVRFKEAETKIKEAEANGIILDPREKLKYTQEMAEYMDSAGQGEVYLPTGTKYPVTPTGTGISVGVKDGDPTGWCGAFVNDVLGERIIGDSYEQKLSLINSQMPVVGAVGVMASPGDYAKNGHVVIVEKINPDGTLSIVESNGLNPMKVGRRNIPVTSFDGFIIPSSSKAVNTPGTKGADSASIAILNQKARGTGEKKYTKQEKELLNQIESTFANPNSDLLEMLPLTAGGKEPSESEKKSIQSYSKVLSGVAQLEKTIASTDPGGVFTAVKRIAQSKLPFQDKPSQIKAQITALIPQVARGVYGEVGVLTDTDIERYTQLLPTLNTTEQIQQSLLDLMYTSLYNGIESDLDGMARGKVDVSRFTGQVQQMRDSKERLYAEKSKTPTYTFDKQDPEYQQLKQVLTKAGNTKFTLKQLQALLDEGYTISEVTEYFNQ